MTKNKPAVLLISEGYDILTIDISGQVMTKEEQLELLTKAVADLTIRMNDLVGQGSGE